MTASSALADFAIYIVIRGHHNISLISRAATREHIPHDYTVNKDGLVAGCVSGELSKLFWTFLASGVAITA